MKRIPFICLAMPLAVMGCSSGGAGFEGRADAAQAQFDEVVALSPTVVMPTGPTDARFDGSIALNFFPLVLGDLTVTANFAAGSLDGSFGNFVNGDDERVSGSGTLTGTFAGNAISAEMSGSGSSAGENFTVTDQPIAGEFRGVGATAIYIDDQIEVISSATGAEDIFVTLIATRD